MAVFIAKLFLRLMSFLPYGGPYWLARKLTPLWMRMSPGKLRTTIRNLERCFPDMGEEEREKLIHESFVHYVASILEVGHFWFRSEKKLLTRCNEVVGEAELLTAIDSGDGVLILGPHYGSWEYLSPYLGSVSDFGFMYKPASNADMDQALIEHRSRGGHKSFPTDAGGVRALFGHLKRGSLAYVLADQEPSLGQGRFVDFFGVPALTGVLSAKIPRRTGCRVFFCVVERLPGGRCRIHFFPAGDDIYSEDLDVALNAVNRGVEQCVNVDRAQYLWSYRRFKTRPEGEPPFYG